MKAIESHYFDKSPTILVMLHNLYYVNLWIRKSFPIPKFSRIDINGPET